jgi:pimeloyl-ACP methyl ester carboxylesterase
MYTKSLMAQAAMAPLQLEWRQVLTEGVQMTDATLVTIHGLFSSPATWDRLDAVWRADQDLRSLRIHPFGYGSPRKPGLPFSTARVPDYDDIAQLFATEYATVLKDAADVAIVSHSQGGLVLQRFLEWMLNYGRGLELARIRTVVMLACPNGGSEYLKSVRRVLGLGRHPQVGSLDVLDRRITDTQRRVLDDIVRADGVNEHHCRIPFHVYAGDSDNIVKPASAQSAFPGASTLAGGHSSILDPAAPGNRTAEAVKEHILTDLSVPRAPGGNGIAQADGASTRPQEPAGTGGSPKYVVNIGEKVEGLMIGDGGFQYNDFRPPPATDVSGDAARPPYAAGDGPESGPIEDRGVF